MDIHKGNSVATTEVVPQSACDHASVDKTLLAKPDLYLKGIYTYYFVFVLIRYYSIIEQHLIDEFVMMKHTELPVEVSCDL